MIKPNKCNAKEKKPTKTTSSIESKHNNDKNTNNNNDNQTKGQTAKARYHVNYPRFIVLCKKKKKKPRFIVQQ